MDGKVCGGMEWRGLEEREMSARRRQEKSTDKSPTSRQRVDVRRLVDK